MKSTMRLALLTVMFLPFSYAASAQSFPVHNGLETPKSNTPDRTDLPTSSAEKQKAMDTGSRDSSGSYVPGETGWTPSPPASEQSVDHTTSDEVGDLATKYRKAREAKAKKLKEDKEAGVRQATQKSGQ